MRNHCSSKVVDQRPKCSKLIPKVLTKAINDEGYSFFRCKTPACEVQEPEVLRITEAGLKAIYTFLRMPSILSCSVSAQPSHCSSETLEVVA